MTRHRKLLPILALLSLSALATSIALPFTKAQAQDDLLPQQQAEPPRSILPPPRASEHLVSNAPASRGADDPRGSSDRPGYGQPYSPPPSGNPPASTNVMTPEQNVSPPPPPSQTWALPRRKALLHRMESWMPHAASSAVPRKGLRKLTRLLQRKGQPYSPPPSGNPPASTNVMTPDASPPPLSQTWGPPPPEGTSSSNGILDAARSFGASEGLAKVDEDSFQRKGQPYSPPPSGNPPASANVMTPDASHPPPPSQTWGPSPAGRHFFIEWNPGCRTQLLLGRCLGRACES